jgi:hypothetical protein
MKSGKTAMARDLARESELRNSMIAIASNQPYKSLCYDAVRGSDEIHRHEIQTGTR